MPLVLADRAAPQHHLAHVCEHAKVSVLADHAVHQLARARPSGIKNSYAFVVLEGAARRLHLARAVHSPAATAEDEAVLHDQTRVAGHVDLVADRALGHRQRAAVADADSAREVHRLETYALGLHHQPAVLAREHDVLLPDQRNACRDLQQPAVRLIELVLAPRQPHLPLLHRTQMPQQRDLQSSARPRLPRPAAPPPAGRSSAASRARAAREQSVAHLVAEHVLVVGHGRQLIQRAVGLVPALRVCGRALHPVAMRARRLDLLLLRVSSAWALAARRAAALSSMVTVRDPPPLPVLARVKRRRVDMLTREADCDGAGGAADGAGGGACCWLHPARCQERRASRFARSICPAIICGGGHEQVEWGAPTLRCQEHSRTPQQAALHAVAEAPRSPPNVGCLLQLPPAAQSPRSLATFADANAVAAQTVEQQLQEVERQVDRQLEERHTQQVDDRQLEERHERLRGPAATSATQPRRR